MRKILSAILAVSLLIFSSPDVFAGKGYSSGGGRSYSSGSRSSSFSSGSRSSSFSSGSKSYSAPSKSYSSGSKSYSSGGSKSYTSPSKSSSSGGGFFNKSNPSTGPPKSNSYSSSGSSYSKKPTGNFQSLAAGEQRKAESRIHYQKATAPKETYTTPKGNTVTIKKDDSRVLQVRNMPEEKWVNREERVKTFYHHYYTNPPAPASVVHYNDPYSTFFWMWLLTQSLDTRAHWAYHHRSEMDDARYRDLLAKDAKLEARIKQLEAEKKGVVLKNTTPFLHNCMIKTFRQWMEAKNYLDPFGGEAPQTPPPARRGAGDPFGGE